jgi:hypothetical protein
MFSVVNYNLICKVRGITFPLNDKVFMASAPAAGPLRRIGVAPEACIVFEDAPFGIEAARRAGMRAVAVCTSHSAQQLGGPHVVASVRNYHELIESNFLGNLHAIPA